MYVIIPKFKNIEKYYVVLFYKKRKYKLFEIINVINVQRITQTTYICRYLFIDNIIIKNYKYT